METERRKRRLEIPIKLKARMNDLLKQENFLIPHCQA